MDRLIELLETDQHDDLAQSLEPEVEYSEVEVYAFSIEEALKNAAEELGTSIINLEYEILERGTSGFLGFGKKPHRVLVKLVEKKSVKVRQFGEDAEMDGDMGIEPSFIANQDGKFKVVVRKNGVMLKVDPPKGTGSPVKKESIHGHLMMREIVKYDTAAMEKEVNHPSGKWVKIWDYFPSPYDSKLQVQVSPDEMKAFVTMSKPEKYGRVLDIPEVINGLKSKNVFYGIKENVIQDAIDNDLFNMSIAVAEGDLPVDGKDAEIKYHFKTDASAVGFQESENGSVDFHKLDLVQSVVVGQVLATLVPSQAGKTGKTVTGRVIPARNGRDLRLVPGNNTHLSPDGMQIASDINGQAVYKNGKVNVEPVLEITGDVDLSSGDINFPGNVVIYGNVNDTFKVYSGANVEVKGHIGKADVVAEGNIVVRQGIQGKDSANIVCGGDLYARFIERARVKVEGYVYVTEAIMHSQMESKQKIFCQGGKKSQIVGGLVRALYEINAKNIGAEAYTETVVEAGTDPSKEERIADISKRREEINKEMPDINKQLNNLSMMMSSGALPPDKQDQFNMLSEKSREYKDELSNMEEELMAIQAYLENLGKDAKISASKVVFPGVKIKIKNAILIVKNDFKYVTFYREGAGNIKPAPYEKSKELEEKSKEMSKPKRGKTT